MKALGLLLLVLCWFFLINDVFGQDEPPMAQCIRFEDDGSETITPFDVCTSFCCGGTVVDNSTSAECCGSIFFGSPYNPKYEHCCEWWTGLGRGVVRQYSGEQISCCGTNRIAWGAQACCFGHPDPPVVFDFQRSICCNAHAILLSGVPREHAMCCGDFAAYDRRFDSCPCRDGNILRNVTASRAACCETPEGLTTSYVPDDSICCMSGQIGEIGVNFCCGELGIGTIGDQVCCSGKLVNVVPRNTNLTECCSGVPFDPTISLCCDGQIMMIVDGADQCCDGIPFNAVKSICCITNLWSTETQGTECCGGVAFFPDKGSFCCNGEISIEEDIGGNACCGEGEDIAFYFDDRDEFLCCNGTLSFRGEDDSCCEIEPYSSGSEICCDGVVFARTLGDQCCEGTAYFDTDDFICCDDGPFGPFQTPRCCNGQGYDVEGGSVCCSGNVFEELKWPACCVDVGYDAFTHTCCGAVITEIPNGSNAGECCGDIGIDRKSQLCCSGENITIAEGIPRSRAECCEFEAYNNATQLCCAGVIREKIDQFTTRCCGTETYNTTEQICCEGMDGSTPTLFSFEFGMATTACCGATLFDTSSQFCCDGFLEDQEFDNTDCCLGRSYNRDEMICCEGNLLSIGGVPPRRAECCGSRCMYLGVQRCCNDRIYEANIRSNNTCMDF